MEFLDAINDWVEKTEKRIGDVLRTTTYLIGNELVTLSPVDTGRFKGNWQMTIDMPTDHSLIRYDKEGNVVMDAMKRVIRELTPGQVAYIQNTVEYGYDLEYGSSTQAPNGMVRITEAKFELIVKEAILLNK